MQEYPGSDIFLETAGLEARIRPAHAKRHDDDGRYSCFNRGQLFMIQERERQFLRLLARHKFEPLAAKEILEIDCGTGYWLHEFTKWGAQPHNYCGSRSTLRPCCSSWTLMPAVCPNQVRKCGDARLPRCGVRLGSSTNSVHFRSRCRHIAADSLGGAPGNKDKRADYLVRLSREQSLEPRCPGH